MQSRILQGGWPAAALALALVIAASASAGERTASSGSSITGDALTSGGGVLTGIGGSITAAVGQFVAGQSASGSGAMLVHGVLGPVTAGVVTQLSATILGPASVIKASGSDHSFEASVSGATGTVHYQWLFEDESKIYLPIGGEENPTLVLTGLTSQDEGNYICEVSDDITTVQSLPVHLTVTAGMSLFEVPQFRDLDARSAQE